MEGLLDFGAWDFDDLNPWGIVTVGIDTVDGPYGVVVRQRLFVRTTRRRAVEDENATAAFISSLERRTSLPERGR